MNRTLILVLAIVVVNSCKTRGKSSKGESIVSDDLRLSFKPHRPRVGEEFTVQIEILRDGEVVTDGAGSELTVQFSYRCGSNKNYSRAQLAEANDGIAEIDLTIGTRRGQATTCAFRAVADDVTREKFSVKLRAGDNYRQHDHQHRPSHDQHQHTTHHTNRQGRRCGQGNRHRGYRQHQQVTISKPVTANARGRVAVAKEFTVENKGSQEVDIELIDCGNARLFRYQPRRVLEESPCHVLSSGKTKMLIIGTVNRKCDFAIDGRKIDFDTFSSGTFRRPACPESPLEQHDVAFHKDNHRDNRRGSHQWQAIRQDDISRMGNHWNDETLVRVDGWWCRFND